MNFSAVKKYNNVRQFKISNNESKLFLIQKFGVETFFRVYFNSNTEDLVVQLNGLFEFELLSDRIILATSPPGLSYELVNNQAIIQDFILHLPGEIINNKFYCLSDYNNTKGYLVLNYENLEILNFFTSPIGINGIVQFVNDELFISCTSNLLILKSLSTNEEVWRLNINELLNVEDSRIHENNLIVIQDKLIFTLHDKNWRNYATYCIKISTGEILMNNKGLVGKKFTHNGYLYMAFKQTLKIMNPENLEIKTIDLSEQLSEHNLMIESKCSYFYGNSMYFAARPDGSDIYSYWGILDLVNFKLTFCHEMLINDKKKSTNNNRIFVSKIRANDKMVGVFTQGWILNVFEKM